MKERICNNENCTTSLEGRDAKVKYCNRKCKNNHNYHKRDKKTPKVVKEINPMFLTRGEIHYAGITVRGG